MAQNYVTSSKWRIKGNKSGAKQAGKTPNPVDLLSKEFLGSRPPSLLHVSSNSCLYLFLSLYAAVLGRCLTPWMSPTP